MPRDFKFIVSLGVNCEVAYQLKIWRSELSAASQLEALDGKFDQSSFLLDWCISPLEGVCALLESKFAGLFEKNNLTISSETDTNGYNYVTDHKYGVQFQHIFSRIDNIVTPTILENEYDDKKDKVAYLVSKLLSVIESDQATLYIRRGEDNVELLRRLADAFKKINPRHNFHIISVRSDELRNIDDQYAAYISFYQMPYTGDWKGDASEWSKMLRLYTSASFCHTEAISAE